MPDPTRMELDVEQAIRQAVRRAWPDLTVTAVVAALRHEGEVDSIDLLMADTRSGMRPGFSTAAPPGEAQRGFNRLVELCREAHPGVETGRFGAHMVVSLVNDGPVTFLLRA